MSKSDPWVLGISNSHNGAVCLLHGDEIVASVQEERLVRRKRQRTYGARPSLALRYCLDQAGIKPSDLSLIVYCAQSRANSRSEDVTLNPILQPARHGIPVVKISHHLAHAVSAFATSGFAESAVLVVDGMGSPWEDLDETERAAVLNQVEDGWETISLYSASGTRLRAVEKHLVPKGQWLTWEFTRMPRFQSLGGIFSAASWQIFGNHQEAGKVMGLAPYGTPDIPPEEFFRIVDGRFEFSDAVPNRFQTMDRWPKLKTEYQNLSASAQAALEQALLHLCGRLRDNDSSGNLCYAGGVALNSVANERILRESGFADLYVMPAAEDSGPAIGAAYWGLWQLTGENTRRRLVHDSVGRPYSPDEIALAIESTPGIEVTETHDVLATAVDLLTSGKIVGWFQGGSELGPRALGQRSILCDPRSPDAKATLNSRVKHREAFRPFAPVVPLENVDEWFDLDGFPAESPYMLRVLSFREDRRELVPGVVHVDGTGRLQTLTAEANGLFYHLVKRFEERTGVPVILNTSFNIMGEPIIETPEDALWCFLGTGIDALMLGDRLVTKAPGFRSILDFCPYVKARRFSHHRLVNGETIDLGPCPDSYLTFNVSTPWGATTQIASPNVLPVLSLMDGKRTGWEILESLPEQTSAVDEGFLMQSLGKWQSAAQGELLLDNVATPREVVEMLYQEREPATSEASLTRMLIRLRRIAVIGFQGPGARTSEATQEKVTHA